MTLSSENKDEPFLFPIRRLCFTSSTSSNRVSAQSPSARFHSLSLSFGWISVVVRYRTRCIQLFRQRLSHKSVKAYLTMPIGIMGRKSLALIDWGFRCLPTRKKKAWIHMFVLFRSMSLKHLTPITHNTFWHCRVRFCWRTFLETAQYVAVNFHCSDIFISTISSSFSSNNYFFLILSLVKSNYWMGINWKQS